MQGATVQQLLKSSDCISGILESLKLKLTESPQSHDHQLDSMDLVDKAIDLKLSFRFLVDGIETNRSLVQVQKQQIERKKVFIEGLHYYKATLKSQIQSSKVDLSSLKDYIQQQPTPETDWIQDFPQQQSRLLATLQQFKQRKTQYQQKQAQKQQIIGQLASQQEKYKKTFPQQVKKLYGQVAETSKLFSIKEVDALGISEFKSKKIEQIHSILYPLKLKELIDLKHVNQFNTEQLEVTIEKGNFSLYTYARENKIMIEQKQLRFYIACVQKETTSSGDKQQIMAVSISRRQDFTTEEIFNNLLLQQKITPIYPNPTSEAQRNTNTKYSQLNWIGQILGSPSCLINGNQFIEKIKNRVFNLNLVKYAVENVVKKVPPYFFPLFTADEQGLKMTSFPMLDSKKIMITKCQKTTFDQYRKDIYVPEWVIKAINNYAIMKEVQKTGSSSPQSINTAQRQLLNMYIENNNLEELQTKDFYSYYRFELVHEKNVLMGYLLVPTDYPNRRSVIRLCGYKNNQQVGQILNNGKGITLNLDNSDVESTTRTFSEDLKHMEIEVNEKIKQFIHKGSKSSQEDKKKQGFWVYFQINRLISLLIEKSLEQN